MNASTERAPGAGRVGACGAFLAAILLLLAGGVAHVAYLLNDCPLDLSGDEAHYWEWSRRLDWSYYSKGPLVAYLIAGGRALWGGLSVRLLGDETLAVRLPAVVLSVLTGAGLYVFALRTTRRAPLALASVALLFTVPIFAVGGVLMTIDAPLACCYVWALVAFDAALRTGSPAAWLAGGVITAVGLLAKYNMLLIFPVVGLTMLTERSFRPRLRSPWPYVATLVGLAGLAPIAAWNMQHDWVSFRHVAGQAGMSGSTRFFPDGPLMMLLGRAAVIGPVWFGGMLAAVASFLTQPRVEPREAHEPRSIALLLYATLVPWGVFFAFSLVTKVQPNWPVLGDLPAVVLLVLWLARCGADSRPWRRRLSRGVVIAGALSGAAVVVLMHYTHWLMPLLDRLAERESPTNLTPIARVDPTSRLRGWSQLGAAVGRVLETERSAGADPFILTDDYQLASQIAFYAPGQPTVYCLQAVLGDRMSQYDLWENPITNPDRFVGRPCVYVGSRAAELFGDASGAPTVLERARLAQTVEHRVAGRLMHIWTIYAVERFAGVPPQLVDRMGTRH